MNQPTDTSARLTRPQISDAVSDHGWRCILGVLQTFVRVGSLDDAVTVSSRVASIARESGAADSLWVDIRSDRVILILRSPTTPMVTRREVELAAPITAALAALGRVTGPDTGGGTTRSVQGVEIGIDALDIPAVRPFWQAVLGYVDDPGAPDPQNGLVDPLGQGPTVWFQQMDAPRPQRNRLHFDVSVPHDETQRRIQATLDAGGTLVYDDEAPAFWVLADPEGNEACVTTWLGRD